MFRVVATMTDSPTSRVMHDGYMTPGFQPEMGWEQGDTLATTMFNVYIDTVLETLWGEHPGLPLQPAACAESPQQRPHCWRKLVGLMFADDLVRTATSHGSMQNMINIIRDTLLKWRIKASVSSDPSSKTAVMVVGPPGHAHCPCTGAADNDDDADDCSSQAQAPGTRPKRKRSQGWSTRKGHKTSDRVNLAVHTQPSDHTAPLLWGTVELPYVSQYTYLGVRLTNDGKWDSHIATKINDKGPKAAGAVIRAMKSRDLPIELRLLPLKGVVVPTVTYAAEAWYRPTAALRQQLHSFQMRIVKGMMHCGGATTTCKQPSPNHSLLQEELGLLPLHMDCEQRVL